MFGGGLLDLEIGKLWTKEGPQGCSGSVVGRLRLDIHDSGGASVRTLILKLVRVKRNKCLGSIYVPDFRGFSSYL